MLQKAQNQGLITCLTTKKNVPFDFNFEYLSPHVCTDKPQGCEKHFTFILSNASSLKDLSSTNKPKT